MDELWRDAAERAIAYRTAIKDRQVPPRPGALNDVALNQVLVSFGSDATTRAVIERIQAEGTCWCSGTEWHGRAAMRISVSSWATDAQDVELSLSTILRIAASIPQGG